MKSYLLSLLLIFAGGQSFAQLSFKPTIPLLGFNQPVSLTSADIDGDHDRDLAYSTADGKIFLQLNAGGFVFEELELQAGVGRFLNFPIASGDLNENGKEEIVYFDNQPGVTDKIVLFSHNGEGISKLRLGDFPQDLSSSDIKVVDLDGDNHLDIVVGSGTIYMMRGDGAGNFTQTVLDGVTSFKLIEASNLTNDNFPDVITSTNDGISVYVNTGAGYTKTNYSLGGFPNDITSADFNGDGFNDIICIRISPFTGEGQLKLLINNGAGNFSNITSPDVGSVSPFNNLAHADLDNDGKEDFFFSPLDTYGIIVMKNNGNAQFTQAAYGRAILTASNIATDLNADGVPELIRTTSDGSLEVYHSVNSAYEIAMEKRLSIQPIKTISRDLNQDGILDLVTANINNSVAVHYGKENGFESPQYFITQKAVYDVTLDDFTGDGFPDIVFVTYPYSIGMIHSDGLGGFENTITSLALPGPFSLISSGDFDNDSKIDILSGNAIHFGDGAGSFPNSVVLTESISPLSIGGADMNGDDKTDVVVANGTDIFIATNLGLRTFSVFERVPSTHSIVGFSLAKINNDNKNDIVARWNSTAFSQFSIFSSKENGEYEEKNITTDRPLFSTNFGVTDFNHDGLMDVAAGISLGVQVFVQKADGSFEKSFTTSNENSSPDGLLTGDFTGNGNDDIITFSLNQTLQLIENEFVKEPLTSASGLTFENITDRGGKISFQKGSGGGRLVVIREVAAVTFTPTDNTFYLFNPEFKTSDALAEGTYAVMSNSNAEITVTGLTGNTTYHVAVYEFNSSEAINSINYLTSTFATGSFTTKMSQTITFTTIEEKSITAAPFSLTATASSGLPVTFSVLAGTIGLTGNTLTISSTGPVTIRATQIGNSTFAAADPVDVMFCVIPAVPTISIANSGNGQYTLTSSSAANYQWVRNDTDIPGATEKQFVPTADGVYQVKVLASTCFSISAPTDHFITGLEAEDAIRIFPNPATSSIFISTPVPNSEYTVRITDMMGHEFKVPFTHQSGILTGNISALGDGLYIVQVTTGGSSVRKKIYKGFQP